MLTVGLVVEGFDDEAAIGELVQKCASPEVQVICRRCGPAPQLMKKFPGFLEEFRHVKDGSPIDKAIVIRDADQKNPDNLIGIMRSRIATRNYPFVLHLLVIVNELEAWLIADETAISSVTGKSQKPISTPESLNDPKRQLQMLLSDAQITYTAEQAKGIAAAARTDILAARCPSFKRFQEAVIDC